MTPDEFKRRFPALGEITEPDLEALLENIVESEVSTGTSIIPGGADNRTLYLIVTGRVQVSLEAEGEIMVLGEFGPGQWVGEMGLIEPAGAAAIVTAIEDSRVLCLSHDDFMALRRRRPMLTSILLRVLTNDLAERLRLTLRFVDNGGLPPNAGSSASRNWFVQLTQHVLGIAARTGT